MLDVSLFQVEENVKLALCGVRLQEGVLKFLDDSSFLSSSDKFRERLFIPYHNTSCFIALLPIISRNLECTNK